MKSRIRLVHNLDRDVYIPECLIDGDEGWFSLLRHSTLPNPTTLEGARLYIDRHCYVSPPDEILEEREHT